MERAGHRCGYLRLYSRKVSSMAGLEQVSPVDMTCPLCEEWFLVGKEGKGGDSLRLSLQTTERGGVTAARGTRGSLATLLAEFHQAFTLTRY